MMDVGEKGRPPGEPPDGHVSWVKKVTGSGTGGIPSPEEVLDVEFVIREVLFGVSEWGRWRTSDNDRA